MKTAIVTISIGDSYQNIGRLTHPWMYKYANRIGSEFIVLSNSTRTIAHYEKFRIYDLLKRFDRIIYLDVDVLVRDNCPNLFEIVPETNFGIYDEGLMANSEERKIHKSVIEEARRIYEIYFNVVLSNSFYNTGVMVISKEHNEIFKQPEREIQMRYSEQPLINLRLMHMGIAIKDIGYKFNRMPYIDDDLKESRLDSHIIHYAGLTNVCELINEDLNKLTPKIKHELITISDRYKMLDYLKSSISNKRCVEIGTYEGHYSAEILKHGPADLWLIDPWINQSKDIYPDDHANTNIENFEKVYYQVLKQFTDYPNVHVIRDFSYNAVKLFDNDSLDFVYIDAIHTFESCFSDMLMWFHKLKIGGWMCGHDYTGKYLGVKYAVDTFTRITGQKVSIITTEPWASWGIRKQ
jgi:lipopolysaccharide biosynthesis glycosyltransferase